MIKHLLFSIVITFLSNHYLFACSCALPSSFCESIVNRGELKADLILRGKVIESTSKGKVIQVEQLLLGTLEDSKFLIQHGFCDLYFGDLRENSEYIIALNKNQDQFNLIACAISFLKIEKEVIKGKIAPGINRLDYNEILKQGSCGLAFNEIALSQNLQIYPNPTSDAIRIHNIGSEYFYDNLEVNIFDVVGRKIGTRIHDGALQPNEEWLINIQDFATGVYFVKVFNAFQEKSFKLIKV